MQLRRFSALALTLMLTGCGSITLPAAVKMNGGEVLTGTTTAALSGGTFQVKSPTGSLVCSGNYDALDTNPVLMAPVTCNDGRYGTITMTRDIANQSGIGTVRLASGETGNVAFGKAAPSVFDAAQYSATSSSPAYASAGSYGSSGSSVYSGNCPTPDSIAADGKRCGKRSAAYKPGGYSGWSPLSSGGTTYVRGHYRNGHYVRGHTRRR